MENRIKKCQGGLFAEQTSAATMRADQLRLWLASFACVLLCAIRRIAWRTHSCRSACGTIRLKLLKLAGLVRIRPRRINFALASACPYADEWHRRRLPCLRRRRDAGEIAAFHPTGPQEIRNKPSWSAETAPRPHSSAIPAKQAPIVRT